MNELTLGNKIIKTERPAFIMGIANATPDSFYSKSRFLDCANSVFSLIENGADIIDIGGESTRPGFTPVDAQTEIDRIIPLIKEIRKQSNIPISVDTTKYEVIKAAYDEGADVLNDVWALEGDERKAAFSAENGLSVILMHAFPVEHENEASVKDIVKDVSEYLKARLDFATSHGIPKEKIIFDPGIGFGKTFEENVSLIKNCGKLSYEGIPVLMALSRKRCIGQMTDRPLEERLVGTLAANLFSMLNGAKILRVHDVKETLDILNIAKNML